MIAYLILRSSIRHSNFYISEMGPWTASLLFSQEKILALYRAHGFQALTRLSITPALPTFASSSK